MYVSTSVQCDLDVFQFCNKALRLRGEDEGRISLTQNEARDLFCGANCWYIPEKLLVAAFKTVSHAGDRSHREIFVWFCCTLLTPLSSHTFVSFPRGRLLHGRHFTYKSITGDTAITFVSTGVEGAFATEEHPYAAHGPWLQVSLSFFFLPFPPLLCPKNDPVKALKVLTNLRVLLQSHSIV